jgi:hypothetical protein
VCVCVCVCVGGGGGGVQGGGVQGGRGSGCVNPPFLICVKIDGDPTCCSVVQALPDMRAASSIFVLSICPAAP